MSDGRQRPRPVPVRSAKPAAKFGGGMSAGPKHARNVERALNHRRNQRPLDKPHGGARLLRERTPHLNPEVERVVGGLIDPDQFPPFRLPDGGRPTFVNSFRDIEAMIDNAADTTLLTAYSGFAVARRDPRCALIVSQGAAQSSTYQLLAANGTTGFPATPANVPIKFGIARHSAGFKRHGDYLCPWVFEDGNPRFWLQSVTGGQAQLQITGAPLATLITIDADFQLGKQRVTVTVSATTDGAGTAVFTFPVARQGYVSLTCRNALSVGFTLTVFDQSTNAVRHLAAPNFWDNIADIDSIRVNSMALMYSDRTSEFTTQGDIVSYQASGGVGWDEVLKLNPSTTGANDPYSAIVSNTKLCFAGKYKAGRYIPVKSAGDARETAFIDIGDSTAPWDLSPIAFSEQLNFLVIAFNANLSAGKIIGEWRMMMHVEGESESQWRDSQKPTMHPDVLKEARHIVASLDFDLENPKHLAFLWNIIKKVTQVALPYASAATSALPPAYQAPARLGLGIVGALTK